MAAVTLAGFGMATAASASTTSGVAHATITAVPRADTPSAKPELTPKGCNGVNFCSYNQTNGGHLCFQTDTNRDLWPDGCADANQSAYNRNGNAVDLYFGYDYGGAYYTLYSGNYLLYMSQNSFNECKSCAGYGDEMANNVVSSRFL